MADRSSDMTLAFTLAALQRLADPAAAIDEAREWSEYVGAVSAEPNAALAYTRERGIRLDFFSGTRTIAETLYGVQANYATERHVLVGVPEQASLATERGWEFQTVADAAERAGWELGSAEETGGSLGRLVERLRSVVGG